jgi:hypothetical protein
VTICAGRSHKGVFIAAGLEARAAAHLFPQGLTPIKPELKKKLDTAQDDEQKNRVLMKERRRIWRDAPGLRPQSGRSPTENEDVNVKVRIPKASEALFAIELKGALERLNDTAERNIKSTDNLTETNRRPGMGKYASDASRLRSGSAARHWQRLC